MGTFKYNIQDSEAKKLIKKAILGVPVAILKDKPNGLTVGTPPFMTVTVEIKNGTINTKAPLVGKVILGSVDSAIESIEDSLMTNKSSPIPTNESKEELVLEQHSPSDAPNETNLNSKSENANIDYTENVDSNPANKIATLVVMQSVSNPNSTLASKPSKFDDFFLSAKAWYGWLFLASGFFIHYGIYHHTNCN